jgi:hypothetical protein
MMLDLEFAGKSRRIATSPGSGARAAPGKFDLAV